MVPEHRFNICMRLICSALTILAAALPPVLQAQTAPANREDNAVYAIYVTRHGVRSPTGTTAQYNQFSSSPWPSWSVPPGYLTPHGFELMKLFGAYDRQWFASQDLVTPDGCDDAARVTIHADSDQRTRETARALAEGMFPGCKIAIDARKEGTNDPLFHLPDGSVSAAQARSAAAAVLARVGGDPQSIAQAHHAQLVKLDHLLATCGPATPGHTRTSIFDIPASITPGQGDHIVTLHGPLNTAGTLAENLLLEYTEGMPAEDVGWGCVNGSGVRKLIDLHTEAADLAQRTPAVAIPQAAALLHVIHQSILQAISGKAVSGAEGKPEDKLLFLVGHDTNLLNMAGALNLNWRLDGRSNDTPPGSALVFELWKNRRLGTYTVQVYFTAQTLEQMRSASPLTLRNPPPKTPVSIPGCPKKKAGYEISCFTHALERTFAAER